MAKGDGPVADLFLGSNHFGVAESFNSISPHVGDKNLAGTETFADYWKG